MKTRKLCRAAILLISVCAIPIASYAAECTALKDLFVNPFNKNSAMHRPIGSGAVYASDSDPATLDWKKANSIALNTTNGWGTRVAKGTASDPLVTITGNPAKRLPVTLRMPKGFDGGSTMDANASIYDSTTGIIHERLIPLAPALPTSGGLGPFSGCYRQDADCTGSNGISLIHEFFQLHGTTATTHTPIDADGLGHTPVGKRERNGMTATGISGMMGLLRGEEVNKPGFKIQHALHIALPRKPDQIAIMISREIVWPAASGDGSMNEGKNNTGHIPYGALLAIPPESKGGPNLDALGLSEPGRRVAEAIRDYGMYVTDGAHNPAMRGDQYVSPGVHDQIVKDFSKIYKYIRMVKNNDGSQPVAGGGTPLAPNCAFDAGATGGGGGGGDGEKINGSCGSAQGVAVAAAPTTGLCAAGTASAVNGTGPWIWSCKGSGGGSTASCSAPKKTTGGGGSGGGSTTLRVEAGGNKDVTVGGVLWKADTGFTGGDTIDRSYMKVDIANTTADPVYLTEREGMSAYALPVTNGNYTVKLHFAENSWTVTKAGQRVFNVKVENVSAGDVDIFAQAPGKSKALIKTINVTVSDGKVDIAFAKKAGSAQKPIVSAIEVLPN